MESTKFPFKYFSNCWVRFNYCHFQSYHFWSQILKEKDSLRECGRLTEKAHLVSHLLPQQRKLLKGLMGLVSLQLLQVHVFFIFLIYSSNLNLNIYLENTKKWELSYKSLTLFFFFCWSLWIDKLIQYRWQMGWPSFCLITYLSVCSCCFIYGYRNSTEWFSLYTIFQYLSWIFFLW